MKFPEEYRQTFPGTKYETKSGDPFGAFIVPPQKAPKRRCLKIIASGGTDEIPWEHVSVSIALNSTSAPTWEEMCFVKDLFWEPEDCTMQLHPPDSRYINHHPGCLHIWRPVNQQIPIPPLVAV
jgi:hypothetical protein